MLYLNVPRIMFWLMFMALAVAGECPWWVPVAAVLYDLHYPMTFMLPWMRKQFEAQWQAKRQRHIDAVMGRIEPPAGRKDS